MIINYFKDIPGLYNWKQNKSIATKKKPKTVKYSNKKEEIICLSCGFSFKTEVEWINLICIFVKCK